MSEKIYFWLDKEEGIKGGVITGVLRKSMFRVFGPVRRVEDGGKSRR